MRNLRRSSNNEAVSPVIATVLLLAITVVKIVAYVENRPGENHRMLGILAMAILAGTSRDTQRTDDSSGTEHDEHHAILASVEAGKLKQK